MKPSCACTRWISHLDRLEQLFDELAGPRFGERAGQRSISLSSQSDESALVPRD